MPSSQKLDQDDFLDAMLCIQTALKRERLGKGLVLALGLAASLGLGAIAQHFQGWRFGFFMGLSLSAALLSLLLLRNLIKEWQPKNTAFFQALHQPQQIVWCFSLAWPKGSLVMPRDPEFTLNLGLENGQILQLRLKIKEIKIVEKALHPYLHQATLGYSPATAQYFALDPALLKRPAEEDKD